MTHKIIKELSREEYDKIEAVNPSRLALLKKSPRHFQENLIEESPAMRLGTAIHMAYLEPGRFKESYLVEPAEVFCDERGPDRKKVKGGSKVMQPADKTFKDHREYLDEWRKQAVLDGKFTLTVDEMEKLTGMLATISDEMSCPQPEGGITLQEILQAEGSEVTALAKLYGFDCKGRIDLLSKTSLGLTIIDVKKSKSAHAQLFKNEIYNLDMDMKAAFYMKLFKADAFIWLAIDDKAVKGRHPIGVYNARWFLEIGEKKLTKYFETLARCHKENYWPYYSRGVADIFPSDWMIKTHEDQEFFEEGES